MLKYLFVPLLALLMMFNDCKTKTNETAISDPNTTKKQQNTPPEWTKNAVIYEVNVRQYSDQGNLDAVSNDLERIKNLGVDIVWLMPIHPIGEENRKGTLGSYYAVKDYKAVNPEFGTLEDLKNLVNKAHELEMKVILDWVANHSAPDNVWVEEHLDYYTKDSLGNAPIPTVGTDWTDVADLNYDNPEMRQAMKDALKYWVTEADIDGYRCDVAGMVPLDFWIDATSELNKIKPLFWLAEDADPKIHEAFDMSYAWPLKDLIMKMGKGEAKLSDLKAYHDSLDKNYQPADILMNFTTNHDENSWHESVIKRLGKNHLNFAVMAYTQGGMPLIYSGQEAGMDKALEFFEKDLIPWGTYKYTDFYTNLIRVYKENSALWNGAWQGEFELIEQPQKDVLIYRRFNNENDLIIVQNYGKERKFIPVDLLKDFDYSNDILTQTEFEAPGEKGIEIEAHSTLIFKKITDEHRANHL